MHPEPGTDPIYAACLRFFVELQRLGVEHVVISPGSRSTPLAVSARSTSLTCHVQIDERVAGFQALGIGRATDRPAVLVCSSGTAGANYLPAVIEANHAGVPMIVCTADRPPELRRWGAGQTVDQPGFYGDNTRWSAELPVPSETGVAFARSAALRAFTIATTPAAGPVHLNWPLREPLEPLADLVVPAATVHATPVRVAPSGPDPLLARLADGCERGLIVVGPSRMGDTDRDAIAAFARSTGWPVVADPAANLRGRDLGAEVLVVTAGEALFAAAPFVAAIGAADVVVRVGVAPVSKAYRLWLEAHPPRELVLVAPATEWADPTHHTTAVVAGALPSVFGPVERGCGPDTAWARAWRTGETLARTAIDAYVGTDPGELGAAAATASMVPPGANLVVSSSMPIRDLEIVLGSITGPVTVHANRGANGIDGVLSTALGVAVATTGPTVVMIGDVATVHDLGGLAAIGRSKTDVVIVLIDNDGGGIFSFLPLARQPERVHFDELFHTAHGTDLAAVAEAHGIEAFDAPSVSELRDAIGAALAAGGPHLVRIATSAGATVAAFAALRAAVTAGLAEA